MELEYANDVSSSIKVKWQLGLLSLVTTEYGVCL